MSEVINETKNILKEELYRQYDWFYNSFLKSIQVASDEFFTELFDFHLISVSKNVNILFQGDDYFVTKVRIDKQHDIFFRSSDKAVKIILDKILGENKKFDITKISELEAKIISSFNDYLFNVIFKFLLPTPPKTVKRKNFDTVHLTLFVKDKQSKEGAKIILSLPQVLLEPKDIPLKITNFSVSSFKTSKLDIKMKIGTTKFPLKDIKNLEKEDIVIFENSDINSMELIYKDYRKKFKVNPNLGLITSIDNDNGGRNMDGNSLSQNLWDNIQVEMSAEFEKVKITLGELKNIEEGLVVDISSVYDNKISLSVENKTIAKGELVIINDRYGVRIDEVFASEGNHAESIPQQAAQPPSDAQIQSQDQPQAQGENAEEEFDYSDFELDDQDI